MPPSPPPPPVWDGARIAVCLTGMADHGNRIDRFPTYYPTMYKRMLLWLIEMRQLHNVEQHIFFSLDMVQW